MAMYNENEQVNVDKIEQNDLDYVFSIFHKYLTNHLFGNDGVSKYYYQYECDSNQTAYERLMDIGAISISARSYEETMVLNSILRIIIDGHTAGIKFATNEEDENEDEVTIENLTMKILFNNIGKNKSLSQYKNYVRYVPLRKKFNNFEVHIIGDSFILTLPRSKTFTKQIIMNLISDGSPLLRHTFTNKTERIHFILSQGMDVDELSHLGFD
jgi:hypothetical protein